MKKIVYLICLVGMIYSVDAQVYVTPSGSFILFHNKPDNKANVTMDIQSMKKSSFGWPDNEASFVRAYRESETTLGSHTNKTDDDLKQMWHILKSATSFSNATQYHPALLMALGQATYLRGEKLTSPVTIAVKSMDGQVADIALKPVVVADRLGDATIKEVSDNRQRIQLSIHLPSDSWITSAHVYKKPVGAARDHKIDPMVFTTTTQQGVVMHIRDTLHVIGEFLYRIEPIDAFGNVHSSLQAIYASNYNATTEPLVYDFNVTSSDANKNIRLSWKTAVRQRVRGFDIYRSFNTDGPFQRVASVGEFDSTYVDHVETVMQNVYYFIQVLDQQGLGEQSVVVFTSPLMKEKPQPPLDIVATTLDKGIQIGWPTVDHFHHVRGYYVYRRSLVTDTMEQISNFLPIAGSAMTFLDTSRFHVAGQEYSYAIKSESTSYVLSDYSAIAYARSALKRELSAPASFGYRFLDDHTLLLFWEDLGKTDAFISGYHVFETDATGKNMVEAAVSPIPFENNSLLISAFKEGKGYVIQTADALGNKSGYATPIYPVRNNFAVQTGPVIMKPIPTGYRMSWVKPDPAQVKTVQLYEVTGDAKPVLLKSLKASAASYDLPLLKVDQVKSYYISFVLLDGTETAGSDPVIVQ